MRCVEIVASDPDRPIRRRSERIGDGMISIHRRISIDRHLRSIGLPFGAVDRGWEDVDHQQIPIERILD